jgi:hypothetical protein
MRLTPNTVSMIASRVCRGPENVVMALPSSRGSVLGYCRLA